MFEVEPDKLNNGTHVGEWHPETGEIYLQHAYPSPAAYRDTLLHEVIHSISDTVLMTEDRLTERQVNTLSTVLADTITRSPELRVILLG